MAGFSGGATATPDPAFAAFTSLPNAHGVVEEGPGGDGGGNLLVGGGEADGLDPEHRCRILLGAGEL